MLAQSATFAWSMTKRFDEANAYYDRTTHAYDKRILDDEDGWGVVLDASSSRTSFASPEYYWEIVGLNGISYTKSYDESVPILSATNLLSRGISAAQKNTTAFLSRTRPVQVYRTVIPTGGGPTGTPVHPVGNTVFVDRLPKLGSYRVTLTIHDGQHKGQVLTFSDTLVLKNIIIACIGDSYNSGEGNPDDVTYHSTIPCESDVVNTIEDGFEAYLSAKSRIYDALKAYVDSKKTGYDDDVNAPDIWYEPKAHRSLTSGPASAARAIEDLDPHSSVTFIDLASTGAMIDRGLMKPQRSFQAKGQIFELKDILNGKQLDFLVMDIGLNDIGFRPIAIHAILHSFDESDVNDTKKVIDDTRYDYGRVADALSQNLSIKHVLISTYPNSLFDITTVSGLAMIKEPTEFPLRITSNTTITQDEAKNLSTVADYLNNTIADVARIHHWIPIYPDFSGHGYSSNPGDLSSYGDIATIIRRVHPYYTLLSESCSNQGDYMGIMHPNAAGHDQYSRALVATMNKFVTPQPAVVAPGTRVLRLTIESVKRINKNSFRFYSERFHREIHFPAPLPPHYDEYCVDLKLNINNQNADIFIPRIDSNQVAALQGHFFDIPISKDNSVINIMIQAFDRDQSPHLLGQLESYQQSYWSVYDPKYYQANTKLAGANTETQDDAELFAITYRIEVIKDNNPLIR